MNRAEAKCNYVLAMHLSAILGIEAGSADILRYVARLRLEGCDGPDDFDELVSTLAIDDLSGGPFQFKRFHLTKVRTLSTLYMGRSIATRTRAFQTRLGMPCIIL